MTTEQDLKTYEACVVAWDQDTRGSRPGFLATSVAPVPLPTATWMTLSLLASYSGAFLEVTASIYPDCHASGMIGSVNWGMLYAVLDGAVGVLIRARGPTI